MCIEHVNSCDLRVLFVFEQRTEGFMAVFAKNLRGDIILPSIQCEVNRFAALRISVKEKVTSDISSAL